MINQKSLSLVEEEKFLIKRIDEDPITITLPERDAILAALDSGVRFIQLRKYTLMLNTVKSIDPFYPPDNIPPRPKPIEVYEDKDETVIVTVTNQEALDAWDEAYGGKE